MQGAEQPTSQNFTLSNEDQTSDKSKNTNNDATPPSLPPLKQQVATPMHMHELGGGVEYTPGPPSNALTSLGLIDTRDGDLIQMLSNQLAEKESVIRQLQEQV